jgi:hypothetical protein
MVILCDIILRVLYVPVRKDNERTVGNELVRAGVGLVGEGSLLHSIPSTRIRHGSFTSSMNHSPRPPSSTLFIEFTFYK